MEKINRDYTKDELQNVWLNFRKMRKPWRSSFKCDLKSKTKQNTRASFNVFTVISAMKRALKMKETGTLGMR